MNEEVNSFIAKNRQLSTSELSLMLSKKPDWPREYILRQVNGLQRAKTKFPSLLQHLEYHYPPQRALEQASSEPSAAFKASLIQGKNLVDLSGGMGMDSLFFAKHFESVDYVEQDSVLTDLNLENFNRYQPNIKVHAQSAETFMASNSKEYDAVFLDPDRRVGKTRAFLIEECEPNLKSLLPQIWKCSDTCLVKLSPMLDIQQAIQQLGQVQAVFIYSYKNECKELLFLLKKGSQQEPVIHCINETSQGKEEFTFRYSKEQAHTLQYEAADAFILDPNVSILKAGAFKLPCKQFPIHKLAANTHLYTSAEYVASFPGRQFKVLEELSMKKCKLKKANVICKNYHLNAEAFKKKYGIQEGGSDFILAYRDEAGKSKVLLCQLVSSNG